MGFLPEEVLILILSFLPVKSLFQFRCVSKSWRSFILSHPKLLGQGFVLAKELYPIVDDDHSSSITYRLIQLLGSCNGFFLIRADEDFFIWNPSTNYCKKVLKYMHVFPIGCREVMLSGLCYDESKDDYTVLIAIKSPFGPGPQADFCSVKRRSWSHTYYNHNTFAKRLGAAADGCLYWLAIDDEHCDIMHFDPWKKKMVDMTKPKLDKGDKIVGLGVIRDSLLCLTTFDDKNDHIKVLGLVKGGVKLSWPILFVVPYDKLRSINISWSSPSRLMPLCFSKEGEFLMLMNDSQLLALDPTSGSLRIVKQEISNVGPSFTVVTYMETLALASSHKLAAEEGFIATMIRDLIPILIIPCYQSSIDKKDLENGEKGSIGCL